MVAYRKVTGKALSMPAGIGIGAAISLGLTLAGTAVSAWMMSGERIDESGIGYIVMAVLLVSSMAGAMIASALIKHRRLMVCIVSGVVYFVLLGLINVLFFGGKFQGVLVTALLILGGSLCSALLGIRPNGKSGRGKLRYRTG